MIASMSSNWSNIDNMSAISFDHRAEKGFGNIQKTFHVGIDHYIPIIDLSFVNQISSERQTGIVDENVYFDLLIF